VSNTKLCATKTCTSKSIILYPRWVFEDGLFVAKCKIVCNKQKPIFKIHLGFFVAWFCIPGGFWRWIFVAKYKIVCNKKPIFKIHLGLLLHNFVSQMGFEEGIFVVHDILFRTFEDGVLYFLGSCKIIADSHSCFVFSTAPWMLLDAWINFFCSWHGVTSDTYSEPTFTLKPKPCKEEELGAFKRESSHKKTWK